MRWRHRENDRCASNSHRRTPSESQNVFASDALRYGFVCHEPGRQDARSQPRPTPAMRLGEEEERLQPLRVIMCRSPVPGSTPMFRRNHVVDIDNTDVEERNVCFREPAEEVVGGPAIAFAGGPRARPSPVSSLCPLRS
jgi:hypothetical protein